METFAERALALYRVSTETQGGEDDIPVQRKECHDYAEKKGWTIVEEITEKISGYKTEIEKREDLKRVMHLATSGEIDILLVYHSDRIGRQIEFVGFLNYLREIGVDVYSVKEGLLTGKEHIDSLTNFIKFWQAEGESKKTSQRVSDAMNTYNAEGEYMGGVIPYGYKTVDTGVKRNAKKTKTIKKIVKDENESKVVEMLFNWTIELGWGAAKIAKALNEKGYLTKNGKQFRHNVVSRMLKNPIYMGYKRYNTHAKVDTRGSKLKALPEEEWKLQPYNEELAIITPEQFNQVQELIEKRDTKKNGKKSGCTGSKIALLSGLTVCHCGARLKTDTSVKRAVRKSGKVYEHVSVTYRCQDAPHTVNHGKRSWGRKYVDEYVENEIIKTINSLDFEGMNEEVNNHRNNHTEHIAEELKNIEKELSKKELALSNSEEELEKVMLGESKLTHDQIAKLLNKLTKDVFELKARKEDAEKRLEESQSSVISLEAFKDRYQNWAKEYAEGDHEEKQAMIATIIEKVILKETSEIEIHLKLPTNTFNTEIPENVEDKGLFFGDKGIADDSNSDTIRGTEQTILYKDILDLISNHEYLELVLKVRPVI